MYVDQTRQVFSVFEFGKLNHDDTVKQFYVFPEQTLIGMLIDVGLFCRMVSRKRQQSLQLVSIWELMKDPFLQSAKNTSSFGQIRPPHKWRLTYTFGLFFCWLISILLKSTAKTTSNEFKSFLLALSLSLFRNSIFC